MPCRLVADRPEKGIEVRARLPEVDDPQPLGIGKYVKGYEECIPLGVDLDAVVPRERFA
jgi:hypothetical protein